MNVEQLIKELEKMPKNMQVFIKRSQSDFECNPIDFIEKQVVTFSEDPGGKPLATDVHVIIREL